MTTKSRAKFKAKKPIPFEFVIEALAPLKPFVRPMFGAHAIYVEEKIVLILRDKPEYPRDCGIWVATELEHHKSLKKQFPLRNIELFGGGLTAWQNLPVQDANFESLAGELVELVLARDPRIGRVPAVRGKKSKPKEQGAKSKPVSKL